MKRSGLSFLLLPPEESQRAQPSPSSVSPAGPQTLGKEKGTSEQGHGALPAAEPAEPSCCCSSGGEAQQVTPVATFSTCEAAKTNEGCLPSPDPGCNTPKLALTVLLVQLFLSPLLELPGLCWHCPGEPQQHRQY
ncbi:hypothetical protein DV515_00015677 [Chloebia gouldiae]|uniref:Uncharacterized protein n=1 Tax=Chloebia gouldiae TaxID=44316 RepID=A0A3L8RW33_CHLGU|nr:hypothetical protein DV515_00015677 [Chloebia gouldiae]